MIARRALNISRWLAVALIVTAGLLSYEAVGRASIGLGLVAVALVLVAVTSWRLSGSIEAWINESRAWSEVAELRTSLAQREALWTAMPAPAAAWDTQGALAAASAEWIQLGMDTTAPPTQAELVIGEDARTFVVDHKQRPDGSRLVVLREITRERQALQAKDELLALVGHELRTPLSSIKGYGQLMARQLTTVQEQVQRLDRLISDVLDAATASAGRLTLSREPLAINDLVSSAVDRFSAANPEREIDVQLEADALIEADAERLGQVLDNLLSNAAKYSEPGTTIAVRSSVVDGHVRVAVIDHGRGIPAEHLPRLFDRFYRVPVENSNRGSGPQGFGLGLSIVRDLVEAHRGRVEVTSAGLGKGSTFTIVLPIALALHSEHVASSADDAA